MIFAVFTVIILFKPNFLAIVQKKEYESILYIYPLILIDAIIFGVSLKRVFDIEKMSIPYKNKKK